MPMAAKQKICPLTNRTNAVWMDTVYWPALAHKAKAQFNLAAKIWPAKPLDRAQSRSNQTRPCFPQHANIDLELAIRHIHSKRHTSEHMEHI